MSDQLTPATVGDLRLEIDIDAPTAKVWQALTLDLGAWWPAEFYTGGVEGGRTTVLEPTPGGLMKESWDDGGGLVWATVIAVEPERRLQVQGVTFPSWGGPNIWFGSWSLTPAGDGTKLVFEESTVGKVSSGNLAEKEKGWGYLYRQALPAYLAGEPVPPWVD